MDFSSLLKNANFQSVIQTPSPKPQPPRQAPPAPKKQAPSITKPQQGPPNLRQAASPTKDGYKVKSSTGKEFVRKRKQASSEYRSMADTDLLKAYDHALNTSDDKKRKRVLYYVRNRGLKVRQMRRKLNGSE